MPDTTDNVIFEVYGNTAEFATDYGTSGYGFTMSHVQIVKLAFGDNTKTDRIYANNPLPVTVSGNSGGIQGISGEVRGTGGFEIRNHYVRAAGAAVTMEYLAVAGSTDGTGLIGITGYVQGASGAYPIKVTGDVTIPNNVNIIGPTGETLFFGYGATGVGPGIDGTYWPVVVTGGRHLSSSFDDVGVTGTVTISGGRQLTAATDAVKVMGFDQGELVPSRIFSSTGVTIGASGDALKVAFTNANINATVNVSAVTGVTNATEPPLKVQGYTGSSHVPVTVRGENNGAVEVAATSALNVNVNNSSLTIDDTDIVTQLGTTGDIYDKLNTVATNTATISTIRTDLQNGSANVTVNQINRPTLLLVGNRKVSPSDGAVQISANSVLKAGITIKAASGNIANVFIGSTSLARNINNGYPLSPGESLFLEIGNANLIYVRSNSGSQTVNYIGS
tara:strand:+ start:1158 stop:2501 length:1344 start_codon:yes stop_codon:yes gene_type:complete